MWKPAEKASIYDIQISRNSNFESIEVERKDLTTQFYDVNGLKNSTTYYWRVRSGNRGGSSEWSQPWSFSTIIASPKITKIFLPQNNMIGVRLKTNFSWEKNATADYYQLQLSSTTDFKNNIVDTAKIKSDSIEISGLLMSKTYFWRVRAENEGGSSNWSEVYNFTTLRDDKELLKNSWFKFNGYAVFIGVSKYKHKKIDPLNYADADAKSLFDFFGSPKGGEFSDKRMQLLINEEATKAKIDEAINVFLSKATDNDYVLIFIAGHGDVDPNDQKNHYLLTYDTDPEKMASTGFHMEQIDIAIKREYIKAKNILVFIDACHSGYVSYSLRGSNENTSLADYYIKISEQTERHVMIFSSSEGKEKSQEHKKWGGGHGIFTWAILEALNGNADYDKSGVVDLGELVDYVTQKVKEETNSMQHPHTSAVFRRELPVSIVNQEILQNIK
jgi:hypothetical protein